jgi:hypothetical protein
MKKYNVEEFVEGYKNHLVAKGYSQVEGVDYEDNFFPLAKMASITLLLSLTMTYDLELEKMDAKTTSLHCELKEKISMKQLEGFVVECREHMMCQLKRSLYGLKLSSRQRLLARQVMWTIRSPIMHVYFHYLKKLLLETCQRISHAVTCTCMQLY